MNVRLSSAPEYWRIPVKIRTRRVLAGARHGTLSLFNTALARTERPPSRQTNPLDEHPPIFILGPPRSGTTLLMQLLVQSLNVGYLSNQHRFLYGNPALLDRVRPRKRPRDLELNSDRGSTKGAGSPWEGADWWYRFFPRHPAYVDDLVETFVDGEGFGRSVSSWTDQIGKSLLFKNNYASLRLRTLTSTTPSALYIHVVRDEVDNAHSLLEARFATSGDFHDWWSMKPPGWQTTLDLDPTEQVLFQIRQIHGTILNDLASFGVQANRVFKVRYEDLCSDTHGVLKGIQAFADDFGIQSRTISALPRNLGRRSAVRIPHEMYATLIRNSASSYLLENQQHLDRRPRTTEPACPETGVGRW